MVYGIEGSGERGFAHFHQGVNELGRSRAPLCQSVPSCQCVVRLHSSFRTVFSGIPHDLFRVLHHEANDENGQGSQVSPDMEMFRTNRGPPVRGREKAGAVLRNWHRTLGTGGAAEVSNCSCRITVTGEADIYRSWWP